VAVAGGLFVLLVSAVEARQIPITSSTSNGTYVGGLEVGTESLFLNATVDVEVQGPNGEPIPGAVYVTMLKDTGQAIKTVKADGGKATFTSVPKSGLTVQVMAPGYETAKKSFEILDKTGMKVKIELQPMNDKEAAAASRGISALNPKAQKDIGRAMESLRANHNGDARTWLEAAQKEAPNSAEIAYLFGVYASQMNDQTLARSYFSRALELNPNHLSSLLAMGQDMLHEHKAEQASTYFQHALEVEPSSWRAHMLMAQADLFQKKNEDAVKEAERAIELGHDNASGVQPLLAHALFETGQKELAIKTLKDYIATHPSDDSAPKLLARLTAPPAPPTIRTTNGGSVEDAADVSTAVTPMSVAPNWLPPDVDEKIPAVEPGTSCSLQDVVAKAGAQLVTFVHDVDRFTATESLTHESINRFGIASAPEKRKFDYMVAIQDLKPGYLGVTEYRNGGGAQTAFPEGVVTSGLPALVLVFHPYYAPNYEMTCEGLARMGGLPAWQIHFRQIPGKPNELKSYQFGVNGPSYAVALKGRAWISADNYQVVRMETDIVAPIPQIKLLAEHTAIEYGPVNFKRDNVTLWLPQSAEVFFAWRGKQMHRRHSFNNYLLFGVDENQRINTPKDAPPIESQPTAP
jgi:tetratricopeptide (TPR) repeat protein